MTAKKGSSTSSKRGISAPANQHVQEKMKSGNPTPAAETSQRASGTKSSKKRGK